MMENLNENKAFGDKEVAKVLNFAELRENIEKNDLPHKIIEDVKNYISRIGSDKNDDDLWEIIAQNCNPKWKEAKEELFEAKIEWEKIYDSPERIPLGLIGSALESNITCPIEERLNSAREKFHQIDKDLKSQEHLIALMDSLKEVNDVLGESCQITKLVEIANNNLLEGIVFAANDAKPKSRLSSIKDGSLLNAFKQIFNHKEEIADKNTAPKSLTIKKPVL